MSKIIIGIVGRYEKIKQTSYEAITKNNLKYLHNQVSYLGIISYNYSKVDEKILSLCDGIIFQGGNQIYPYHFAILNYAIQNHIPVLGICMGCQLIGLNSLNIQDESKLIKVKHHYGHNKHHQVFIKEQSKLFTLFGRTIITNTRHRYALKEISKPYRISAQTKDQTIEALEYINKDHFVLGIQWHPEDLDDMQSLYNYFFNEIIKRKKTIVE